MVASGTPVRRPQGQSPPAEPGGPPGFGPERLLDFELELGFVTGAGLAPGEPVTPAQLASHVFGFALVNDWSARSIQAWEYQPLGPFLSKSFATSLATWITPLEAVEPFRVPGPRPGARAARPTCAATSPGRSTSTWRWRWSRPGQVTNR